MPLPYVYRITKYDPRDRDEAGHYVGDVDSSSDHGPLETAYLEAVRLIATEVGVDRLFIREPSFAGVSRPDRQLDPDALGLGAVIPGGFADFRDGSAVSLKEAIRIVQAMLREERVWCRLEAQDVLTVHVGWDQYLYVGVNQPCESALDRVRGSGLFPERLDRSPYEFVPEERLQRPADDAFWAKLQEHVVNGVATVLEEWVIGGVARWHRLHPDSLDQLRAAIAPRALLEVLDRMPDLPADPDDPLEPVPALFTAVMPDRDGILRARWQTDPTPDDRAWAEAQN